MGVETQETGDKIDIDIPCSQCGYNLRGLEPGGRCPECGGEIKPSCEKWQRGQLGLRGADPGWLHSMRRGLGLILVANLLLLALVFVPESVFRDSFGGGRYVLLYYSTSMWVLAHWGVWKLAAPNRELRDRGMRGAWTKTVRWATWVSMLAPGWYYLAPSLQRAYRVRVPGWTADIGYWSLFAGILCIQFALHVLHRLAVEDRASKWVVYPGAVIQWAVPGILVLTYLTVGARPPEESLEGLLMFPVPLMGCSLVAIFLPQILPEVIRDPRDDLSLILAGIVLVVAAALMSNVIGFIRVRRAISHDR